MTNFNCIKDVHQTLQDQGHLFCFPSLSPNFGCFYLVIRIFYFYVTVFIQKGMLSILEMLIGKING